MYIAQIHHQLTTVLLLTLALGLQAYTTKPGSFFILRPTREVKEGLLSWWLLQAGQF